MNRRLFAAGILGAVVSTAQDSAQQRLWLSVKRRLGEPDEFANVVVFVASPYDGRMLTGSISLPDFEDLRAAQTSFSSVSA